MAKKKNGVINFIFALVALVLIVLIIKQWSVALPSQPLRAAYLPTSGPFPTVCYSQELGRLAINPKGWASLTKDTDDNSYRFEVDGNNDGLTDFNFYIGRINLKSLIDHLTNTFSANDVFQPDVTEVILESIFYRLTEIDEGISRLLDQLVEVSDQKSIKADFLGEQIISLADEQDLINAGLPLLSGIIGLGEPPACAELNLEDIDQEITVRASPAASDSSSSSSSSGSTSSDGQSSSSSSSSSSSQASPAPTSLSN